MCKLRLHRLQQSMKTPKGKTRCCVIVSLHDHILPSMRYKTTWKLTGVEPFQATLPLDQRREEVDGGEEEEVGHGEACVWRVTGGGCGGRKTPQSFLQEASKSRCGGERGLVGGSLWAHHAAVAHDVGKPGHLGPRVAALAHQGASGVTLKPNTRCHPHRHLATHSPPN